MKDKRKHELEAIHFLRSRPAARTQLQRLLKGNATGDTCFFVPCSTEDIDLYRALVALKLVIPIKEEFRLSLDGSVKDGFIECRLTPSAKRLYAEAFESEKGSSEK